MAIGKENASQRTQGAPNSKTGIFSRYRRLTRSYQKLEERLGEHAYLVFGPDGPALALDEFFGWPEGDEPMDSDFLDRQGSLFWPWFIFNWAYEQDADAIELEGVQDKTVAELYVVEQGLSLDPTERKLIFSANRKPYSFWEVVGVVPGVSIELQDLLLGERLIALEKTGSKTVEPADILFGRVAQVEEGIAMIIGIGRTILPPSEKVYLTELRQRILGERQQLEEKDLIDWEVTIRQLYFDMEQSLFQQTLLQTPGDAASESFGSMITPGEGAKSE